MNRAVILVAVTLLLAPLLGAEPASKKPAARQPAELAKLLLDDRAAKEQREAAVREAAQQAADVIRVMTADLAENAKEEYRRIPWIWRVAIAAGRANEADSLRRLLDASLPKPGQPLRDWQAVVLGGGIINGISLEGAWPGRRLAALIKGNADLTKRWSAALRQAHTMADAEAVPTGTRYDALRMVALDTWDRAGPRLKKYLARDAHPELQMGAVSGLADVEHTEAGRWLMVALPDLTKGNRELALTGLLRTADRATRLLDGLQKGTVPRQWLSASHRTRLLEHSDEIIRRRAAAILEP